MSTQLLTCFFNYCVRAVRRDTRYSRPYRHCELVNRVANKRERERERKKTTLCLYLFRAASTRARRTYLRFVRFGPNFGGPLLTESFPALCVAHNLPDNVNPSKNRRRAARAETRRLNRDVYSERGHLCACDSSSTACASSRCLQPVPQYPATATERRNRGISSARNISSREYSV